MDEPDKAFWGEDVGWWDRTRIRWDNLSIRTRRHVGGVFLALLVIVALTLFSVLTRVPGL